MLTTKPTQHRASGRALRSVVGLTLLAVAMLLSSSFAAASAADPTGPGTDEPPERLDPEWPGPVPGPWQELRVRVHYRASIPNFPFGVDSPAGADRYDHPLEGVVICTPSNPAWDEPACGRSDRAGWVTIRVARHDPAPRFLFVHDQEARVLESRVELRSKVLLTPACRGQRATIVGTPRADWMKGTSQADVVQLMGGNDTFAGYGGNDVVCGASGNDHLQGHGGQDFLYGDTGDDRINGGAGNDYLAGNAGRDALDGGAGYDQCRTKADVAVNCERRFQ